MIGINRRDRGDGSAGGTDQRADLLLRDPGDAIDRRNEPRKSEVELRRFDRGLGGLDRGVGCLNLRPRGFDSGLCRLHLRLRGQIVLRGVVEILLRDGLLLGERDVAVHIELGSVLIRLGRRELRFRLSQLRLRLRQLSVGLRELSLGLIERGLKRPRIDLKQQLPLLDERTFGVILLQQIAGHLGLDGGVYHAVERADPLAVDRNIFLPNLDHLNRRRSRTASRCTFRTPRHNRQDRKNQTSHRS